MSFNRRYAISLFVLLGNLAIPFLFVLNKLWVVNNWILVSLPPYI